MDIIIIGRIAEDGILELIRDRLGEGIFSRYPKRYFNEGLEGLSAEFGDEKCMKILDSCGADVFVVGRQGIFSALYKMGNACGTGLKVDLLNIPVKQFCIEIADLLIVNPYTLSSLGCILVCTLDGAALAAKLNGEGYPAKVIGYTTKEKACCAINGDITTYLEP